jgi:phosphonate transport system substrate-binding protein
MRRVLAFMLFVAATVSSLPAAADWRKEMGIFKLGLIEAAAPPQSGRDAIRHAFENFLSMPVEIIVLRDWSQLIDAQASGRINYAIYSSAAYASAVELCNCLEPVAAPIDVDGAAGVRSVLLVRQGKASSLEDIVRIKVVAPGPDDLTGWMAPSALLARSGIVLNGDENFLVRTGTAGEALEQFRDGLADAIFGWERAAASGGDVLEGGTAEAASEVRTVVLWRSPLIRFGPHAVQKSLDGEAKKALFDFLEGLHGANPQVYDLISQGHGGGFTPVVNNDYSVVREIAGKVGLKAP